LNQSEEEHIKATQTREETQVIVQDFVNNKENAGTVVVIDLAFNKDLCDPLRKELWRGYIEDTPKEYWPLEVLGTGWMIEQQMPVITVIKGEQKLP